MIRSLRFSFIAAPPGVYNLAAGTAHQEVFYFSRAIHKIGYTIYKIGPYVIRCTDSSALLSSWSEETYRLKDICEPRKGDWIIDGGAFQGDTTLWFSDLVGLEGKIYTFEPFNKNYNILVETIEKNGLKNVITIPKALYRESKIYSMIDEGQGAALVENASGAIEATTIDEFTQ